MPPITQLQVGRPPITQLGGQLFTDHAKFAHEARWLILGNDERSHVVTSVLVVCHVGAITVWKLHKSMHEQHVGQDKSMKAETERVIVQRRDTA
jgi:hypothetical protein